ncbi:hypothetical protein V6N11_047035 [Hibiscus sabdariffa]|uniref:RNase H type-1 domain-containing protein n=1 Tax=Hibiscus sabdariffa TaxID=183260 RepID=A0ABR2NA41_9ROSI
MCTAASTNVCPSADTTGTPKEATGLCSTPLPPAVSTQPVLAPISCPLYSSCKATPVWATVTAASLLHGDFLAANDNGKYPRSRPFLSTPTWSPPPSGTIAISVDGAFIQAQGAGIGVVARDSAGIVLGGFAQHSVAPGSSTSAESSKEYPRSHGPFTWCVRTATPVLDL